MLKKIFKPGQILVLFDLPFLCQFFIQLIQSLTNTIKIFLTFSPQCNTFQTNKLARCIRPCQRRLRISCSGSCARGWLFAPLAKFEREGVNTRETQAMQARSLPDTCFKGSSHHCSARSQKSLDWFWTKFTWPANPWKLSASQRHRPFMLDTSFSLRVSLQLTGSFMQVAHIPREL